MKSVFNDLDHKRKKCVRFIDTSATDEAKFHRMFHVQTIAIQQMRARKDRITAVSSITGKNRRTPITPFR